MDKDIDHNKYKKILIVLLSGILLLVCLWNIGKLEQPYVLNDEFGYLGLGAFLNGKDWRALISTSPYYGFGLSLLYYFLYLILGNSILVYKGAIVLNALFLLGSFLLSLKVAELLFPRESNNRSSYLRILICFFICFYPNTIVQTQIAWSESLLYFWFWVMTFFLIHALRIEKNRMKYMNLFAFLLPMGIWIHQRALGVVVAGFLVLLIYFFYVKKAGPILSALALSAAGVAFFLIFKGYLQSNFWGYNTEISSALADLHTSAPQNANDLSGQLGKIMFIFSKEGIINLFNAVIGKVYYLYFATCFLIPIALIGIFRASVQLIKRNGWLKYLFSFSDSTFLLFLFLSLISTLMISAIFGIQMNSRADTLLYGRYVEFVIGPFLLIGAMLVYKRKVTIFNIGWMLLIGLVLTRLTSNALEMYEFTTVHTTNIASLASEFNNIERITLTAYDVFTKYSLICFVLYFFYLYLPRFKPRSEKFQTNASLCMNLLMMTVILTVLFYPNINYENSITYNLQTVFSANMQETSEYLANSKKEILYFVDDTSEETVRIAMNNRQIKYLQYWLNDQPIHFIFKSQLSDFDPDKQIIVNPKENGVEFWKVPIKEIYSNDSFSVYR